MPALSNWWMCSMIHRRIKNWIRLTISDDFLVLMLKRWWWRKYLISASIQSLTNILAMNHSLNQQYFDNIENRLQAKINFIPVSSSLFFLIDLLSTIETPTISYLSGQGKNVGQFWHFPYPLAIYFNQMKRFSIEKLNGPYFQQLQSRK